MIWLKMGAIFWNWIHDTLPILDKKTEWDRKKETAALRGVPHHSASHLTFDCGNLSLHLHRLIFSTQVGSCHGIKFSRITGPTVLLLSHYPNALVRVHTCVWACERVVMKKKTHIQYLVLDQASTRSKCLWSNHALRSPTYALKCAL